MDARERIGEFEDAIGAKIGGAIAGLWTALPGIVDSFNPAAMTCSVQPAIQGIVTGRDRSTSAVNLPLLTDVPVLFSSGGGCIFTFPIVAGDECLVIFASRHIDAWWQAGGVQAPMSARMHSLSDGFAIVGPRSVPRVPVNISMTAAELRSLDGNSKISLAPAGGVVSIVAPGGVQITTPMLRVSGDVISGPGTGTSLNTHRHRDVTTGSGTSGLPTGV